MVVHYKVDPGAGAVVYSYPPTPQASLFFYIDDKIKVKKEGENEFTEQSTSVIVGQQLKRVSININKSHKAVRVGFHPGGMHRLLGFSMVETIDEGFAASDVFGREMKEIDEQLYEASDFDSIKNIVENFLLHKACKLKKALPFDLAMIELLKCQGNIPIEQIASLACVSLRQFERLSKERIGLPPKLYARIVRFSKAYRLREENPLLSWTQIAYECGYFDQMHLIRDFKQFACITPRMAEKELQKIQVRMQIGMRL